MSGWRWARVWDVDKHICSVGGCWATTSQHRPKTIQQRPHHWGCVGQLHPKTAQNAPTLPKRDSNASQLCPIALKHCLNTATASLNKAGVRMALGTCLGCRQAHLFGRRVLGNNIPTPGKNNQQRPPKNNPTTPSLGMRWPTPSQNCPTRSNTAQTRLKRHPKRVQLSTSRGI